MADLYNSNKKAAYFAWPAPPQGAPAVSVVAPMMNEAEGAASLIQEIASALAGTDHEIIIVDDGSTDKTCEIVEALRAGLPQLRLVRHVKKRRSEPGFADRRLGGALRCHCDAGWRRSKQSRRSSGHA